MKVFKTDGIIIRRRDYQEQDRLLTVYTKFHGKIKVKAVGVRKITSRRGPHTELLNLVSMTLYKNPHLPILTETQTIHPFSNLKENLNTIAAGYYICELVNGLCAEGEENPRVFDLLSDTLERIDNNEDLSTVTREFELSLLHVLGFWPTNMELSQDNSQGVIEGILEKKIKSYKFHSLTLDSF